MARTRREREREREREGDRRKAKLIRLVTGLLIAGKRHQQKQRELLLAFVMNDVLSRPATLTKLSEDLFDNSQVPEVPVHIGGPERPPGFIGTWEQYWNAFELGEFVNDRPIIRMIRMPMSVFKKLLRRVTASGELWPLRKNSRGYHYYLAAFLHRCAQATTCKSPIHSQ